MEDPWLFALAILALLATPGPTNSLLATSGGLIGVRRSLPLIPAEAAGYLMAILGVGLLLSPALAAWPGVALVLRVAVGLYLLRLAWTLWRGTSGPAGGVAVRPAQLFVTTLLNPKALVIALGIMPFGAVRVWPYFLGFLALLFVCALAWIALGSGLGAVAGRAGQAGLVPRLGAVAVGGFALALLSAPLFRA